MNHVLLSIMNTVMFSLGHNLTPGWPGYPISTRSLKLPAPMPPFDLTKVSCHNTCSHHYYKDEGQEYNYFLITVYIKTFSANPFSVK